jgi:hypothetical protein
LQWKMVCRSLRNLRHRMEGMRTGDGVGQSTFVGHVIVLMHRLVIAISEDGKSAL